MQKSIGIHDPYVAAGIRPVDLPKVTPRFLIIAGLSLVVLYWIHLYSFLLFHALIEMFSISVAFGIFMFAWNTRDNITNSSLALLGAAYLAIGAVDLLHTFAYKGMGVFATHGADTATQLWIAARYIESASLAAAPLFATRKIAMPRAVAVFAGLFFAVIVTVFVWPVFPTCYVEGVGLTPFKKGSEYAISAILLCSLVSLARRRTQFDGVVFRLLTGSILLTVASELMFTFYISVYGISNLVGHFFKLGSFWMIYKAIIETGLQQPYTLLFRELARSEERYRDLVTTLPVGVCRIDSGFRITFINPSGLELLGYEEEDVRRGLDLGMLLDVQDREKARKRWEEMVHKGSIGSTEYRLLRKDGTRADVIVNSTPVYRDGELKAIQTSLTDVTELNQLKNRLQQVGKMEAVAVLAGGMAHEVNNVLMGVVGGIELLKLNVAEGKTVDEDFTDVLRGCERIAGLIKHLLAYSRGGRYQSEVIDMGTFIGETLAGLDEHIRSEIRLSCDFPPVLPTVSADPTQLKMVVSEIVNNAAEAIEAEGRIEVDLRSETIGAVRSRQFPGMRPGAYLRLTVRDDGNGMDAEALEHIFEPFYTRKFPGRGLGMAAVYGIVKNHGGWVGVDSEPGRGTTVQVFFPVNKGPSTLRDSAEAPEDP